MGRDRRGETMNRLVIPRKKIPHGMYQQRIQYFYNGKAIGEIILPKRHRDRRYHLVLRELEQKLFEKAIAKSIQTPDTHF